MPGERDADEGDDGVVEQFGRPDATLGDGDRGFPVGRRRARTTGEFELVDHDVDEHAESLVQWSRTGVRLDGGEQSFADRLERLPADHERDAVAFGRVVPPFPRRVPSSCVAGHRGVDICRHCRRHCRPGEHEPNEQSEEQRRSAPRDQQRPERRNGDPGRDEEDTHTGKHRRRSPRSDPVREAAPRGDLGFVHLRPPIEPHGITFILSSCVLRDQRASSAPNRFIVG
ncbi:hypothetical protein [Halobaculum lipolyticum]|uniref:hypothetical protein n=1 Tax=Halobaculum lipolyticum TaxID=3032001 RepID=UPI0024C33381|nr:hypothetical protein [Halobaculum sp. DT31]